MMERLVEVEITEHGTIFEEIERTKVKKGRTKMRNSMKKLILTGAAAMAMLSFAATPAMASPIDDITEALKGAVASAPDPGIDVPSPFDDLFEPAPGGSSDPFDDLFKPAPGGSSDPIDLFEPAPGAEQETKGSVFDDLYEALKGAVASAPDPGIDVTGKVGDASQQRSIPQVPDPPPDPGAKPADPGTGNNNSSSSSSSSSSSGSYGGYGGYYGGGSSSSSS